MTPADWATLFVAVAGALGARELLGRIVDRKAHNISNTKTEVEVVRSVLEEVRRQDAEKAERLGKLETRVDALEDRERQMLTAVAIHDAWDQVAYPILLRDNPQYPPPPSLTATLQPPTPTT